jgi:hypothetical protein
MSFGLRERRGVLILHDCVRDISRRVYTLGMMYQCKLHVKLYTYTLHVSFEHVFMQFGGPCEISLGHVIATWCYQQRVPFLLCDFVLIVWQFRQ